MKTVLISIQPKWCQLIACGQKTLEIRKTRPKLETPFKAYIYCTKGVPLIFADADGRIPDRHVNGKVIGEFTCDNIQRFDVPYPAYRNELDPQILENSCCTYYALHRYAYHDSLFGWHISNLKIYENPALLSEFTPHCRYMVDDMEACDYRKIACNYQVFDHNPWPDCSVNAVTCKKRMRRPPQSWCYVEEL